MKHCRQDMTLVAVYDTGSQPVKHSIAYNLFQCELCGAVCKENVWSFKGEVWISATNQTSIHKPEGQA